MEVRTRVAAAAAAVIPFHCVICFDEFTVKERPPVVLPCGHTYVCLPCAKRLKRCMECREPLFVPAAGTVMVPSANHNHGSATTTTTVTTPHRTSAYGRLTHHHHPPPTHHHHASSLRYGSSNISNGLLPQPPSTPPHGSVAASGIAPSPETRIPLPMPKNLVLLALMEAAERQTLVKPRRAAKQPSSSSQPPQQQPQAGNDNGTHHDTDTDQDSSDDDDDDDDEPDEDEEQYNLNRIISGMATLSGPCGTYRVKGPSGLVVLPFDPRTPCAAEEKKQEDDPITLQEGCTVQIVDFDDGVAKIARDKGYILANSSQLVKVGGPVDECCRLEGLLKTIICRGNDLQAELDENHQITNKLRAQLQAALDQEPEQPIILEPPKMEDILIEPSSSKESSETLQMTPKSTENNTISQPILHTPDGGFMDFLVGLSGSSGTNGSSTHLDPQRNAIPSFRVQAPESPVSIDNSDLQNLPRYRRSTSNPNLTAIGCGSVLLNGTTNLFGDVLALNTHNEDDDFDQTSIQRSNSAVEASSTSPVNYHIPSTANSFDTVVDFRTGLSGHRALQTSKASRQVPRSQGRMMMSEHRGISSLKPARKSSPTNFLPLHWTG